MMRAWLKTIGAADLYAAPIESDERSMSLVGMTVSAEQASERASARPNLDRARLLRPLLGLILPAGLALAWEIVVRMGFSEGRLIPPPSHIFNTLVDLARTGELWRHTQATLLRVAAGFALGVGVGTLLGALNGYSMRSRRVLDPTLQALRAIPSIAWVPLFILWLGIFEASKVTLIAVGVFFPIYLGVSAAIMSVDSKIVEVGRVFRLSGLALIHRILLPAMLPAYVVALRTGLGLGWMFVVAAEFMGASEGLGYLLIDGQELGKPAQIVAAIIAFAVIGKATDWLIVAVSAPFLRWHDAFGAQQGEP
jgi:sulfonate transport system permease protein